MGVEVDRERFDPADYERFAVRLRDCLEALRAVLERPGFGEGDATMGAELELDLVDALGRPALCNREVLASAADPRLAVELDRFNVELNATPVALAGRPFTALARELEELLGATRAAASEHGASIVTVGILPTLEPVDLGYRTLSDRARYRALTEGLRAQRGGAAFHVHIEGEDALDVEADDPSVEGANASFQLHLRVAPDAFARTYNAAQIATAPALAVACNSPMLFGRRLWDETRIALFQQSMGERTAASDDWRPARVSFGHGWVRRGAFELFAEAVAMHPPLLPVMANENPLAVAHEGGVPRLAELRLHHGTVWRWNRAVYDHSAGGHLRIEMRALPSGPTVVDMVSTGAFILGLTLGLAPEAESLVERMTFGHARRNFYEAARRGLDATLLWPTDVAPSPRPVPLRDLLTALLPVARRGLVEGGVAPDEADDWLGVVAGRVAAWADGARWQRRALPGGRARDLSARAQMLLRYAELSRSGAPVHAWPEAKP